MSVALANGVEFHIQELGPSRAPAVAMIHGLLVDNLASWYFTAAPRLAASRRVFLYDLRGHGRSERVIGGYDLATQARDLGSLLDRMEGPIDLVGHSFGSLVALRFALDHPERVGKLILVESPLPPSRLEEMRELANADPEQLLESVPDGIREALLGGKRRRERLARSLGFLLAQSSLLADLAAEADFTDEELAGLGLPTLCVFGEGSSCRPVGDRLASVIPDAKLVVLDGGHYLHLDEPAALTREIESFLDG